MKKELENLDNLQGKKVEDVREVTAGILVTFEDSSVLKLGDRSGIGIGLHWKQEPSDEVEVSAEESRTQTSEGLDARQEEAIDEFEEQAEED